MFTESGTAFTAEPPFVIIGWTLILSSSLKVSLCIWIAWRAKVAAFRALMPFQGEPPACEARPINSARLATTPLFPALKTRSPL